MWLELLHRAKNLIISALFGIGLAALLLTLLFGVAGRDEHHGRTTRYIIAMLISTGIFAVPSGLLLLYTFLTSKWMYNQYIWTLLWAGEIFSTVFWSMVVSLIRSDDKAFPLIVSVHIVHLLSVLITFIIKELSVISWRKRYGWNNGVASSATVSLLEPGQLYP
jgi:hypothetical protein